MAQLKETRLTFRLSQELALSLQELSRFAHRHQADLVRSAVRQFVEYYEANPDELEKG